MVENGNPSYLNSDTGNGNFKVIPELLGVGRTDRRDVCTPLLIFFRGGIVSGGILSARYILPVGIFP